MEMNDLRLRPLRNHAVNALEIYSAITGLYIDHLPNFKMSQDGRYTASASARVWRDDEEVGNVYVLVFNPGDGTGSYQDFRIGNPEKPNEVVVSERVKYYGNPEKVVPRRKTGVIDEAFLPLVTLDEQGNSLQFLAGLDELTLSPDNLVTYGWNLGQAPQNLQGMVLRQNSIEPRIYSTIRSKLKSDVGDPHAIYFTPDPQNLSLVQVGAFLAMTDKNKHLLEDLAKDWEPLTLKRF